MRCSKLHPVVKIQLFLLLIFSLVIDFIVMLSTGSRNAAVTVIVFTLFYILFRITKTEKLSRVSKTVIKAALIIAIVLLLTFNVASTLATVYFGARSSYLSRNIAVVVKSGKILLGLGLMEPGYFGISSTGYGRTTPLDNYYGYLFCETGIVGLICVVVLLVYLLIKIKANKQSFVSSASYDLFFSAFLAWLTSGLGETCVIHPSFPSSIIFLIMFLACADNNFKEYSNGVVNK